MSEHTITAFDDDLQFVFSKIMEMGGHAEQMVAQAVESLSLNNKNLANSVICSR